MHPIDWIVLGVYFAVIIYLGVYVGAKKTKTLGDFFVAGGNWGAITSFVFVFASALAGNEAVVVSSKSYHIGLSGMWYWMNFLFATPIYFLFATYYRRARVYNLAEFLEMRYGTGVASVYSLVAGVICLLFIATFLYAVSAILSGALGFNLHISIWVMAIVVAAYVYSGGMMSTMLTDLLQGLMCLFILGFLMLPFLWNKVGGLEALRQLTDRQPDIWNFTSKEMSIYKVIAMNISCLAGGIAAPWIYNWIAISKDEKTATQCAWAHLWKRIVTIMFALYGIMFAILIPNLIGEESDKAWGMVMAKHLPAGAVGLMIASFFAAAMSSAATYATTSSAMLVDYFYRRQIQRTKSREHYLQMARLWCAGSILIAAATTAFATGIRSYIELCLQLLYFLGIPIYFGVVWRRANQLGMWLSIILGIVSFLTILIWDNLDKALVKQDLARYYFASEEAAFNTGIFVPTALSLVGMLLGYAIGKPDNLQKLKRFYVILNTPIGKEQRLIDAGISLPTLVDAGLIHEGPEHVNQDVLNRLYNEDAQAKIFGPESSIEIRRERLGWYTSGFIRVMLASVLLLVITWIVPQWLFKR